MILQLTDFFFASIELNFPASQLDIRGEEGREQGEEGKKRKFLEKCHSNCVFCHIKTLNLF